MIAQTRPKPSPTAPDAVAVRQPLRASVATNVPVGYRRLQPSVTPGMRNTPRSAVGYASCVQKGQLRVVQIAHRVSNSICLATLAGSNDTQVARINNGAYFACGDGDPPIQRIHSSGGRQVEIVK